MQNLYSVRMRSACGGDHHTGGHHISGAERLVLKSEIPGVMAEMLDRAQSHERGEADFINIVVEKVEMEQVVQLCALPVATILVDTYQEGRIRAGELLQHIGVATSIVGRSMELLSNPQHQMRGAILLDIHTGKRCEPDAVRGIRTSRMDIDWQERLRFASVLQEAGLHSKHTMEALVLATKVCSAPGIIAELCWSDDPGYTAGYIASEKYGYVRFLYLKPQGLAQGGRIFFYDSRVADADKTMHYLEESPVLIQPTQSIALPVSWDVFCRKIR
jgi:6-carboxyhexanoate--CoA ligase